MAVLTASDIYRLVDATYKKNTGQSVPVQRGIVATFVALKESGGNTTITNTNSNGSIDRGLWQWNNKAWPQITDAMALDPNVATQLVYETTEGFDIRKWSHWMGSASTIGALIDQSTHNKQSWASAVTAGINVGGFDQDLGEWMAELGSTTPVESGNPSVTGIVTDPLETLTDWAQGLKLLLETILSGTFWKRIGIGALGLGVVVVAVVLYNKDEIASVGTTVATKGMK